MHASEGGSRGRKVADLVAGLRGRTPLRYDLSVLPFFCGARSRALGQCMPHGACA